MIHAAGENLLVHGLIVTADKVAIQVNVHIVDGLNLRKWHISVHIVNVERVRWHLNSCCAQHLNAIRQRMHKKILRELKMSQVFPTNNAIGWNCSTIIYKVLRIVFNMLVNVIGKHQINGLLARV